MDCKRALHWLRTDPPPGLCGQRVVVGGESAGGHLAMLMGFTQHDASLQPGFEESDSSVQGVFDLFGPKSIKAADQPVGTPMEKSKDMLETFVVQCRERHNPELFQLLSPMDHIQSRRAFGIPWLAVIGTLDSLVPTEVTRRFYALAEDQNHALAVLPGTHHGFCGMPSVRTLAVADAAVGLMSLCQFKHN